jgi:hypothetical protein
MPDGGGPAGRFSVPIQRSHSMQQVIARILTGVVFMGKEAPAGYFSVVNNKRDANILPLLMHRTRKTDAPVLLK